MTARVALLLLTSLALLAAGPSLALDPEPPAVARPRYVTSDGTKTHSTVFFIPVGDEIGVGAVGTAHSFDLAALGEAAEVTFTLPHSQQDVAVSSRYLVKPGRPFRSKGGTLREDFIVFALDTAPSGIRVLEPERGAVDGPGNRVRLLGIPNLTKGDQSEILGTIIEVADNRIEVDLDRPSDLRGWGGAPVVSKKTGRVLGILEGAWPVGSTYRVGVAPIHGVLDALRTPLVKGLGQPFSHYAAYAWDLPEVKGNPFQKKERPRPAPPPLPVARRTPPSDPSGTASTGRTPPPRRYLDPGDVEGELNLAVEYPEDGAIVGNAAGGFLAGRAMAVLGEFKRFDVVFVVDTSGSTSDPTGQDINGNGVVGKSRLGGVGALFALGSTDPGDSILAAEIMAARQLLQGFDARSTRVALVTFAGLPPENSRGIRIRVPRAAVTEEPLTTDYERIEEGLLRILDRGADGMTHMAAGIDQATIELLGLSGALSKSEPASDKVVLFFTDGQPTLPYQGFMGDNVRAVLRAADRANKGDIRIHSFALGPDALAGPIATVEMAARTEGFFTPVRDPADLIQVVEGIRFTDIESVVVHNQTSGQDSHDVRLNADGSWSALVPLEAGKNEIQVTALSNDGRSATRSLTLQYAPGTQDPAVPRELVRHRNRLLERRLLELRRGRIATEREAAEKARKELLVEIDRERAKAAERAARQRKELEIEVEPEASGTAP